MRRLVLLLVMLLWVSGVGACASGKPNGPRFAPLIEPGPRDALVYVYRRDSLRGIGAIDVELGGDKLGKMKNGEYLAFLMDPGPSVLKTRLRWLGLIPRAWSQTRIEARPGRTLFVRIWAQYEAQDPGPAAATVPGRAEGKADVVIFAAPWDAAKAMPELAQTRRAPGP